jgi:TolB protein
MKKIIAALKALGYQLAVLFFLQSSIVMAQTEQVGIFDQHEDVGNPKIKGAVVYNKEDQTYLFSGAGKNMWAKADQFHFA